MGGQPAGARDVVGIHAREKRRPRFARQPAQGRDDPRALAVDEPDAGIPVRPRPQQRPGAVRRAVVEGKHLEARFRLGPKAVDARAQERFGVPARQEDGDTRRRGSRPAGSRHADSAPPTAASRASRCARAFRKAPVRECSASAIAPGGPAATIRPP